MSDGLVDLKAQLTKVVDEAWDNDDNDDFVSIEDLTESIWPIVVAAVASARQQGREERPAYDELLALYNVYWNQIAHYDEPTLDHKWMVIERDDVNLLDELGSQAEDALVAAARGSSVQPQEDK